MSLTDEVSVRCHLQEVNGGVTYRGGEWRCHLQRR